MRKLEPCPLCGDTDPVIGVNAKRDCWEVRCKCNAGSSFHGIDQSLAKTIRAWNSLSIKFAIRNEMRKGEN